MSRLWPSSGEAAFLRFLVPVPGGLKVRFLLAGASFLLGLALWGLRPESFLAGPVFILLGHLPLWVRRQTIAPGGATPEHEEMWVPAEDEWLEQVKKLEEKGKRWDASPWDVTSGAGCGLLFILAVFVVGGGMTLAVTWGPDAGFRLSVAAALLLLPFWLNGIRTTWNPSELRKKGEALAVARKVAEDRISHRFDVVPLLALREGRRGKYPVDARLMLRPKEEDGTGFLGIQIQVAMNNVRGTDYPYLYCVILGREGFHLQPAKSRYRPEGRHIRLVYEEGQDKDVKFLVIRRHADRSGGWHTRPQDIRHIVAVAVEEGHRTWRANRRQG